MAINEKMMFQIFDSKAEYWLDPFYSANIKTATREFAIPCNQARGMMAQYPQDFTLFHTGLFSNDTGDHILLEARVSIVNGIELVEMQPQAPPFEMSNGVQWPERPLQPNNGPVPVETTPTTEGVSNR